MDLESVSPELEHLAEPGGGAGVDEEGALVCGKVFPVSAAERGQTVDRNEALVALPPGDTEELCEDKMYSSLTCSVDVRTCKPRCSESTSCRRENWPPPRTSGLRW